LCNQLRCVSCTCPEIPSDHFFRPTNTKDYIHRVGRTARAGRAGKSVTFVSQYDVELYQKIEAHIGKKLDLWPCEKDEVMALKERVDEAKRIAVQEIKEEEGKRKSKKKRQFDEEQSIKDRIGKVKHKKYNVRLSFDV